MEAQVSVIMICWRSSHFQ